MNKLKFFDSSYFIGKSHFEEDGTQNYLVFQAIIAHTKFISSWKSKGLSDEAITAYATSDKNLTPLIDHYGTSLKQPNKLT